MIWGKSNDTSPEEYNPLVPGGKPGSAEAAVWYHLCCVRLELEALIAESGGNVRRHAVVNTMIERAMGYYYLFVMRGRA